MNQQEHKAESERLAWAADAQLKRILSMVEAGSTTGVGITNDHVQTMLQVVDVTGQLAQVHATLALTDDEVQYVELRRKDDNV